jgi:hypothetical protein
VTIHHKDAKLLANKSFTASHLLPALSSHHCASYGTTNVVRMPEVRREILSRRYKFIDSLPLVLYRRIERVLATYLPPERTKRVTIICTDAAGSHGEGGLLDLSLVFFVGILQVDLEPAAVSPLKRHVLDEDGIEDATS